MFDAVRNHSRPEGRDPLVRALRRYLLEYTEDHDLVDELLAQTLLRLRFGAFAAGEDVVATAFAIAQRLLVARRLASGRHEVAMTPPRVLIVDDDGELAASIELALSDRCEVTTVRNPDGALALIASGLRYDVIFTGLLTPACEGLLLYCDLLREAPEMADTVVFLIGATVTSRARAFIDSVDAPCIELPLDPADLRDLVRDRRMRAYDSWRGGRWHSPRE
jgi:PleD family two-component response regulator